MSQSGLGFGVGPISRTRLGLCHGRQQQDRTLSHTTIRSSVRIEGKRKTIGSEFCDDDK
jgi:hypothetical protein